METAVVALGGNALMKKGDTIDDQFENARKSIGQISFLTRKYRTVFTHGNGPQVGNILIQVESAIGKAYPIPLSVAVAESQGQIGYIVDQALCNELDRDVVSMLTQVLVDKNDPAFKNPTKPVGPFYTKKQADLLERNGMKVMEDAGRGWRRAVPSPKPRRIIEANTIRKLVDDDIIVVAAGGGGIPVYRKGGKLVGMDAVIDKDLASACLAKSIKADLLIILTDVDNVYLDYGRPGQQIVGKMSAKDVREHADHFATGSMKPKVEAAAQFARPGRQSLITSPKSLKKALAGNAGTWFG